MRLAFIALLFSFFTLIANAAPGQLGFDIGVVVRSSRMLLDILESRRFKCNVFAGKSTLTIQKQTSDFLADFAVIKSYSNIVRIYSAANESISFDKIC